VGARAYTRRGDTLCDVNGGSAASGISVASSAGAVTAPVYTVTGDLTHNGRTFGGFTKLGGRNVSITAHYGGFCGLGGGAFVRAGEKRSESSFPIWSHLFDPSLCLSEPRQSGRCNAAVGFEAAVIFEKLFCDEGRCADQQRVALVSQYSGLRLIRKQSNAAAS